MFLFLLSFLFFLLFLLIFLFLLGSFDCFIFLFDLWNNPESEGFLCCLFSWAMLGYSRCLLFFENIFPHLCHPSLNGRNIWLHGHCEIIRWLAKSTPHFEGTIGGWQPISSLFLKCGIIRLRFSKGLWYRQIIRRTHLILIYMRILAKDLARQRIFLLLKNKLCLLFLKTRSTFTDCTGLTYGLWAPLIKKYCVSTHFSLLFL